jgi:1-acyl-sn-glycerol-3-phosphate acyltransferase
MFMDEAAFLAIKAQVPLVPLALIGSREILPMHGMTFRPGLVRLRVGDPISTAGLSRRDRTQ